MIEWVILASILVVLFYSLWRAHVARVAPDNVDARQAALSIWQTRAAELAQREDLSELERQRELDRLRAGVLADAGQQSAASQMGPRSLGLMLSIALILVTAWVGYQQLGGLTQVQLTLDSQQLQGELDQAQSLDEAIAVMQAGIQRHELPERYYSLGQLLEQSGDLAGAYQAYRSARERGELDAVYQQALPEFLAAEAQALLFSDRTQIDLATQLAGRALAAQETNTMALGVLGVAAFDQQNYADAERYWARLLELVPADSADYQAIEQGLRIARQAMGISPPQIQVNLLRPPLDVPPQTPVFVYARISEQQPTPMVVARVLFDELPMQLVLTNEMRMGPMAGLPVKSQVEVVARLALSGGVVPAPGDWQGVASNVSTDNGRVQLAIDNPL
ncbi:MAG: tetratricopeptide repeat protein [Litorivicinus sp.]